MHGGINDPGAYYGRFGLHLKKGGNGRALTWESISEGSFPLENAKACRIRDSCAI